MKLSTIRAVAEAFQEMDVRYLVVGRVAVNAHGYQRLSPDR